MQTLKIKTSCREEFINITSLAENAVKQSGVKDGAAVVFCPHTTAAITINENADSDVCADMIQGLKNISPADKTYAHTEGNSDAHIKSSLVGASETIIIENGKLVLGTWQGIYFCEFDGPRDRTVFIKTI
ncbi:MAG: secondary thiamine-phosphate synthase enzyme YjbQ [Endomicrobia bacterium]|nr:secondary thiamine-phosphate synthase enzyme YjbQ [Endomicrobiia bacterium]MCL2799812.1 secondary thiamine-phosphate synthase enzyme YjbQ [Endomicrobiia bacterium]